MRDDESYIPTTEKVREQYASSAFGIAYRIRLGEFDRWLESVIDEAFERGYDVGYSYGADVGDDW